MSLPYRTRLVWSARWKLAVRNGVSVPLTEPPDLGHGPVAELDYAPFAFGIVRHAGEPEHEMSPDERAAADALLREWVQSRPAGL